MTTLNISDFSCLKDATFNLAPVNVIIGPQGSGKSVTTKLLYFFSDILNNFVTYAERGESIDDYKKIVGKQFSLWFPAQAWGSKRFNINYLSGPFSVRILRRNIQGKASDEVTVTFSEWFIDIYQNTTGLFKGKNIQDELIFSDNIRVRDALDRVWRVRDVINKRLLKELGNQYVGDQTFIPAGRAYFTSIGRLVAGIEQAGNLDPVTIKFARLFANLRDRNSNRYSSRLDRLGADFLEKRSNFMAKLFGGEIKFEQELEFVETGDGRKIPFSSLSSGQQELLPMWSLIDYFNEMDALRMSGSKANRSSPELVYIEEPEAHLFPSAQSLLMEFLISTFVSERNNRRLVLTTHSPYIMSKLNVFLKAGQLSKRKKRNTDINSIVPRDCWLSPTQLSASAIIDGTLINLIDENGLIDARYLDGVSEEIANQFDDLLQIESEI